MTDQLVMTWVVSHGGRERVLIDGEHYVGRGDECTVRLDDSLASRRHAALTVRGDGISVRDLESRNGTYVKQRKLARGERVVLTSGDAVLIGRTTLYVQYRKKKKVTISNPPTPSVRNLANTGQIVSYDTFLAEAERALGIGDKERFARATHLVLASLAAAIGRGLADDTPAIRAATKHALTLAEREGIEWVEELVTLYEGRPLVLPLDAVTTLQRLFATHRWKSAALDRYVERVRPLLDSSGPRGRALLRELESIGRRPPSARPP